MNLAINRPRVVMAHPHLNANVREASLALAESGLLDQFHTTIDTTTLARLLGNSRLGKQMMRRSLPPTVHRVTRQHPSTEIARLLRRRLTGSDSSRSYAPDGPAHAIDARAARSVTSSTSAVYAYEDSALEMFIAAERHGASRIYDLPIGYWRAADEILGQERDLQPDWAATLIGPQLADQRSRLQRKDDELALADHIVVASTFVRDTLSLADDFTATVTVIPYGAPQSLSPSLARQDVGPLRALYVGGLSQRKGISYMFDAVESLGANVTLTVVGQPVAPCAELERHLGQANVKYIRSLPHSQILGLMAQHDVLIFPSLFEGYGLVITEALSQGLPVIATPHSAAPDVIDDAIDGWVVPIRSSEAISSKLQQLITSSDLREEMRMAALNKAQSLRWEDYRNSVSKLVGGATR